MLAHTSRSRFEEAHTLAICKCVLLQNVIDWCERAYTREDINKVTAAAAAAMAAVH